MTPPARSLPQATESVCPVCLRRIPAEYVLDPAEEGIPSVLLRKECPEHGVFSVPVWRGMPDFRSWVRDKTPSHPRHPFVERERGCPFDCGLCPDHAQHTCTGLIEVTGRCNLRCPVCYASAGEQVAPEPSLERIAFQMDRLRQASGACNVQLSGGEPTVRDDLPGIIRMAKARGFALIQCNTNGLRLGTEPGYAASLREAGLDSVYLQCDAADDAAMRSCAEGVAFPKSWKQSGRAAKRESGSCWWRPWRRALTPTVCGRWWKWDCVWGHMSEACIFSPCLRSDVARGDPMARRA